MTTTFIQQQKFTLCEPTTLKLPYAPSTLTELFRDRKTRLLLTGHSAKVVINPLFKAFQRKFIENSSLIFSWQRLTRRSSLNDFFVYAYALPLLDTE